MIDDFDIQIQSDEISAILDYEEQLAIWQEAMIEDLEW